MENQPKVLTDRYEVGRFLGKGAFAKVYFGKSVHTNQSVAIKVIDKEEMFKLERETGLGLSTQVENEISIMRILKHPNVVDIYEVLATKSKIYLIIEYCEGGELITKIGRGGLKEEVARTYFRQLINAVEFCHSRGVYHRDIKPNNLLLDGNGNLMLSDFGLGALEDCKREDGLFYTFCGTREFASPEIINQKGYDGAKADIWSCGIVLFAFLTGTLPFYDTNKIRLCNKINNAQFRCPKGFPLEAKRLLGEMLEPNQENRITIPKIRENIWFKNYLKPKKMEKQVRKGKILDSGGSSESSQLSSRLNAFDIKKGKILEAGGSSESSRLNAFEIITMSPRFNLEGLFGDVYKKQESRFTSRKPALEIMSKLKEVAKQLKFKIRKQEQGLLELEGYKEGRKGALAMDAKIFQVTETFHLVELKKSNGDTLEYEKLLEENLRPALADIVWVWQGEKEKEEQLHGGLQDEEQEEQEELSLTEIVADAWRRVTN